MFVPSNPYYQRKVHFLEEETDGALCKTVSCKGLNMTLDEEKVTCTCCSKILVSNAAMRKHLEFLDSQDYIDSDKPPVPEPFRSGDMSTIPSWPIL